MEFVRGEGVHFWDSCGRRYTDLSSQTMNTLLGQRHPAVTAAVGREMDNSTFSDQDFASPLHDGARDALASLLPPQLEVLNLRINDGSSAVECAVKQARRARGRGKILTIKGIYLGQNNLSIHMRGLGERPMDLLMGGSEDIVFAPIPLPDLSVPFEYADAENGQALSELIGIHADTLACVVLDPIMVSSGVFGGRGLASLLRRAAEACQRLKVPLIFDECQTFGWVPDFTLANHWDIPVDMMALGKGIAGGLPLAACASRPQFDNLDFGDADYTNGGHNLSVAACHATCQFISRSDELSRFRSVCEAMAGILEDEIGRRKGLLATRGVGLIRCIEMRPAFADPVAFCQALAKLLMERGIFVRTYGPCIGLKPPRIIEAEQIVDALGEVFAAVDDLNAGKASVRIEAPKPDFSKTTA
ncbi:MAG: hypothetical protein VR78_06585 [Hoeflea sp. BRH_c9]|nr:MAG: hypothetical protein VR78_06585 [Hoeflea sp. BRH_c9]